MDLAQIAHEEAWAFFTHWHLAEEYGEAMERDLERRLLQVMHRVLGQTFGHPMDIPGV